MTLFNAYVLYKKITETEVCQFRPVVAEELLDGLVMLESARWGCAADDTSIKLQAAQ